jgi:putative tryptophan/tyrosine transport system substrate-binding protein
MVDFDCPRIVKVLGRYGSAVVTAILFLTAGAMPAAAAGKLVAAVLSSDITRYRDAHRAFVKVLAQKGYDQSNVEIIMQSPNPDPISWANSIRKVSAIGADIIITYGAPITLTAMRETDDIPIVFVDVYGPVETGITKSMTLTGRNLTGVSSRVPMITLIKTALEIKPIRTMGVIYNSREMGSLVQLKEIKRLAAQQGFAVIEMNVSSPAGLDAGLNNLLARVDGIYVSECAAGSKGFEKIVHKANEHKIPVLSQMPDAADKGALVSLEVSPTEQGQLAGESAVKVLNGRKAGQIPIATPKKVEMIINMRAAKALDLHVPFQVLSAATKIMK